MICLPGMHALQRQTCSLLASCGDAAPIALCVKPRVHAPSKLQGLSRQYEACVCLPLPRTAAVRSMKSLLFYPVVTCILVIALMVYWIFVTAFLSSIGGTKDETSAANLDVAKVRCLPLFVAHPSARMHAQPC